MAKAHAYIHKFCCQPSECLEAWFAQKYQVSSTWAFAEKFYACRDDNKLGSCVAVAAALLPQQLSELRQLQQTPAAGSVTPVLITHGSKDSEVPLSRAKATVAAAEHAGGFTFLLLLGHCCCMLRSMLCLYLLSKQEGLCLLLATS